MGDFEAELCLWPDVPASLPPSQYSNANMVVFKHLLLSLSLSATAYVQVFQVLHPSLD